MTEPRVPTTQEELSRKALEAIEELLLWRSQERITDGQLTIAINTLFKTVSGLIDEDVFQLISQIASDHKHIDRELAICLKKSGAPIIITRYVGQGRVLYFDCGKGQAKAMSYEDEPLPDQRAKAAFDKALAHCQNHGMRLLAWDKI